MEKNSSTDLLFETALRHLYHAEIQSRENLSVLEENTHLPRLKSGLLHHRRETQAQIERIEKIFGILNIDPKLFKTEGIHNLIDKGKEMMKSIADLNITDKCKGMIGIIDEGKEMLRHFAKTEAGDFAITASAKKIEHYEIASYEILCLMNSWYGFDEIGNLLKASLEEEKKASALFTDILLHDIKLQVKAA